MGKEFEQDHPTREASREVSPARSESSYSFSGSESGAEDLPQWARTTLAKYHNDPREQPWKKTFKFGDSLEHIENTFADDKDLVVVLDPKLPLAGAATIYEQQGLCG